MTFADPAPRNGRPRERWTERDHADQYIVDTMVPLLELADAFPKLVELVGEHLLARFGHAEPEHLRVSDDDVARTWGNLARFTDGMQALLVSRPHPEARWYADDLRGVLPLVPEA